MELEKIKNQLTRIEQKLEERIVKSKGKLEVVDWQTIEDFRYEGKHKLYDDSMKVLLKLGVLSKEANGNFYLSKNEINVNPRLPRCPLYFTKEEYVRGYKEVSCSELEHPISIRKIEVIG